MAKMSCTRHSSNKFGSALVGIIIAFRKNIGGEFSVIRRLLGSKRALYLVNTSEEFFLSYWGEGMIIVSGAILNTYHQFHGIVNAFHLQAHYVITKRVIIIDVFLVDDLANEDGIFETCKNKNVKFEIKTCFFPLKVLDFNYLCGRNED